MTYEFCEAFSGYDMVTRFRSGNTDPGNPCEGDASRLAIPYSGENYHLVDLWAGRYSHTDLCQHPGAGANVITRLAQDNDPNPRNGCDTANRTQIEGGQVIETGRANQAATYVAAACPSGWADAGGSNCYYAANGALTSADIASLTVSCTPAIFKSVTTCTFNNPNKTLPTDFKLTIGSGSINQTTGAAQSCTETTGTVTCTNVPTGNSVGNLPIYGNLGTGGTATKTATGENVKDYKFQTLFMLK